MRASYLLANLFIVVKVFARDRRDPQGNSIDIDVINPFDDNGNRTLIPTVQDMIHFNQLFL